MTDEYKPDGFDTGVGCLFIIAVLFVKPWVLMVLWGWYVVPLGVPDIGMLSAFGLTLVASLLAHQVGTARTTSKDSATYYGNALAPLLWPLLLLGMGALARGIFS